MFWVTALVSLSLLAFVSPLPDCSNIRLGGSRHYNLSAIVGRELILEDSLSTYKATICTNTYASCGACSGPAGFCQSTEFWADCIGVFSLAIANEDGSGVELLYDNGDWGNVGRIKLRCDPNAGDYDDLHGEGNLKTMVARSKHACADSIDCGAFNSCGDCARLGCLWCRDSTSCVPSTTTTCRNFIKDPEYCPGCRQYTSCDTCTKGTCAWCLGTENCVEDSNASSCISGVVQDPDYC